MAAEPAHPEPVLRSGRGHSSERPTYRKKKKKMVNKGESDGIMDRVVRTKFHDICKTLSSVPGAQKVLGKYELIFLRPRSSLAFLLSS